MQEKVEINRIERKKWSFEKTAALVWFVAQCVFCMAYLFGGFSSADERMSVFSVLFKIFNFFSITDKLWYHYVSLLAHCILFIVITILLIKSIVSGIRFFCNPQACLVGTQEEFYNTFKYCIIYVLIANILYENPITGWGIFLFILGMLTVIGGRVLVRLAKDKNLRWQYLVVESVYTLVLGVIVSALGVLISRDVVSNLISGISTFWHLDWNIGILYNTYQILGIEIIHIALLTSFIKIVDRVLFLPTDWEHKEFWKRLFIIACVYIGIDITLYLIMQYGSEEFNIFELIINYISVARALVLPLVMLAGAGWITFQFPSVAKQKEVKEAPSANEELPAKENIENALQETVEQKEVETVEIEILEIRN